MSLLLENYSLILDFLPTEDLDIIRKVNKSLWNYFKDYIYFRCASDGIKLVSNSYLIKTDFTPIISQYPETFRDVLDKILDCPLFCIGGGFPTQCYLNRELKESSDIDVFILGGSLMDESESSETRKNCKKEFEDLINWFSKKYHNTVIKTIGYNNSIFNVSSPNVPYTIQFIFTSYRTLSEVLTSYDSSHNRCGMYLREHFVLPDAQLSISKMTTYFYNTFKTSRFRKARELGFTIYNLTEEQNIKLLKDAYRILPTEVRKTHSVFSLKHLLVNRPIKFILEWRNEYNSLVKPNSYLKEEKKLINVFDYKSYNLQFSFVNNKIYSYLVDNTDTYGLTIKYPVDLYVDLELIHESSGCIKGKPEQLSTLKTILLDITRKAHGLPKTPKHILETTKDIIGQEKYLELCQENKEVFIDAIGKCNTITMTNKLVILDNPQNYLYDDRLNLYTYFGYEYRDYIWNEHIKLDKNSTIIQSDKFKKYRINLIGGKSREPRRDGSKFLTYGYWSYNVKSII